MNHFTKSLLTHPDDLRKYMRIQRQNSLDRLATISGGIEGILSGEDPKGKVILTTGSDGRFENKPYDSAKSNLEIVAVERSSKEKSEKLIEAIKSSAMITLEGPFQTMTLGSNPLFYNENERLVFPTRTWDARFLWGDKAILESLKNLLTEKIIGDKTRAYPHFKDRYATHKRVLIGGRFQFHGKSTPQYDLESGEFYYNPKESIEGVKLGPLRFIQYSLALGLMKRIREGGDPGFISELPQNIDDRLGFIQAQGLTGLSEEQIERWKYVYAFFLKMYHVTQHEHHTMHTTSFQVEDPNIRQDIRDMIDSLKRDSYEKIYK